ncbi:MAG TPA: DNA alkylation repair protein [Patescibacteria group bacterium]|nr:DNA alkylation repair protein [Patescibacteria group bacterium]
MRVKNIVADIRNDLAIHALPHGKSATQQWYKEKIKCYGVATPTVRKIAAKHFRTLEQENQPLIFRVCEELLRSGFNEESIIALSFATRTQERHTLEDFEMFESWLKKYVDNWSKCDDLCLHIMNFYLSHHPGIMKQIKSWTRSNNQWVRRAAAVSFITSMKINGTTSYGVAKGHINDVFAVAMLLMDDKRDLVQKGFGWMLKAASVTEKKKVYNFLIKHEKNMSRIAFRYALEHMPPSWRKKAMKPSHMG